MSAFCPNFSNKLVKQEFESIVDHVGENLAYYLWDKHEGDYAKASSEAIALKLLQLKNRQTAVNPELLGESFRISSLLLSLYPEIDLKFVSSIEGNYAGTIDLDAMQALVDFTKQGADTIPHEYAHYYVEMFSNSDIVKQGILEFGSKEELVQAIGIRTVNMDGKARTWWQKFKDFVKGLFSNKYAKEAILAELTDNFLTAKQLSKPLKVSGVFHQETPTELQVNEILRKMANSVTFDAVSHKFTDKATGSTLKSTSEFKNNLGYDNYEASLEDAVQAEISKNARDNGTLIHSLLEHAIKGNVDVDYYSKFMSKSAIAGLIKVIAKIKLDYDIVASEAILADAEHGIAGITDLLVRNKKTGKYAVMDFKTKLIDYNGKRDSKGYNVNEKGKKLNGFLFSTSKKFRVKSERDGYDFQLSVYAHMLEAAGIPIEKTAIIPLVYSVKNGKITKAGLSTIFGRNDEDNENLKQRGFYELVQSQQTKYDVEYKIFNNKKVFGEDTERIDEMLKDLTSTVLKIRKKLEIQSKVLRLKRKYHTLAKDAEKLLEKISNMSELDALLLYVNYASDHLNRLNKQIQQRYSLGKDAKWDLGVLQSYKEIASSYNSVARIAGLAAKYSDIFGDENVRALEIACSLLQMALQKILNAYDDIGSKLYMETIMPYVGIVRHRIRKEYRNEYIKKNPKKLDETEEEFEKRINDAVSKYLRDNSNRIELQTRDFLDALREIADAGFECSSVMANLSSVYESKDPFVLATVQHFDYAITMKEQRMMMYRTKLQRILELYRAKYGNFNYADLRKVFEDFIEVTDNNVVYLVNPIGGLYLQAEFLAKNQIMEDASKTYQERIDAWHEWLIKNNPIYDLEAYHTELRELIAPIIETLKDDLKKLVIENAMLPGNKRKSWYHFYKEHIITADVRQDLEDLMQDLDEKYRRPNKEIYKNDKYEKMLALKATNDPKRQLYQFFLDSLKTYDYSMPKSLRLNYKLPAIYKRGMERVSSVGIKSATSNYMETQFTSMLDDDIRGTFVDEDGKRIRLIPMYYYKASKKLTPDEQSYDLPTIFYKWVDAAETYLVKRDLESIILLTLAILSTRDTRDGDNVVSLLKGEKQQTASHKENTEKQFAAWVDQVFYNNRVEDMGRIRLPGTDKSIDTAKFIKWIVSFSNKRVMSANLVAGLNNILVGEVNQAEEAFAGHFINKKAYTRATKLFFLNLTELLTDVNKTIPQSKLNKLAQWFGVLEPNNNMTLEGLMRHSVSDYMYSPNKVGEQEMQIRFLAAALMSKEALDENGNVIGVMFDFIDFNEDNRLIVDEKVANFDVNLQNLFSLQLRKVLMSLHGNYSDRSSVAAEAHWYGWMGLALRRWIEPTVARRYRGEYYDSILDEDVSGMHRSFFSYMFRNKYSAGFLNFIFTNIFRAKKLQIEAVKWELLEKHEKQNVIKGTIEFSVAILAYAIFALVDPPKNKDEHDFGVEALWVLKYLTYRLFTDLTFYVLPTSFSRILQDPFPVMGLLEDVIKLLTLFVSFSWFEEYKTGKHLIDNKLLNQMVLLTPGAKQLGRMFNTSQEINTFLHKR